MKITTARYRLLFERPFTTAHGTRDGTDAVFVRIEHLGFVGYGEATLPPYLSETAEGVEALIRSIRWGSDIDDHGSGQLLEEIERKTAEAPAAQNALTTAVLDLCARMAGKPLWAYCGLGKPPGAAKAMVTLACNDLEEVPERLQELPASKVLKVKLGTPHDLELIDLVKRLDDRALLLDANQGLSDLDEAIQLIEFAGERVIAMEQPFKRDDWEKHGLLQKRIGVPVIADESIQDLKDLERADGTFGGVNIKLMKCGGIRPAISMMESALQKGLLVMLGSMSESTLGSTAMLNLAGRADLLDLDGPWLVGNDPFEGMTMMSGVLQTPTGPGIGVALRLHGLFPISAHN